MISNSSVSIGERIRYFRRLRGFSQEQLSIKAGYKSRNAIYNIESGRSGVPTDKLLKIAEVLSVYPEDLYFSSMIDEYIERQRKNDFSQRVIDLSFLDELPSIQIDLSEKIDTLVEAYKNHSEDRDIIFFDLKKYPVSKRELIVKLINSTIEQF